MGLDSKDITLFLGRYCGRTEYRKVMVVGNARWNLQNAQDGVITAEEMSMKQREKTLSIDDPHYNEKKRKKNGDTASTSPAQPPTATSPLPATSRPKLSLKKP